MQFRLKLITILFHDNSVLRVSLLLNFTRTADIDLTCSADYVSEQMRLETNFLNEATNAQKCADFLANTPELKDKVYVPKIYSEVASSERVMVMEYVKGCRWV